MGRWVPIDESETQQEQPKITGRWVPVDDSAPTPKQEEPGLISKAVSAVRQLPADVWQKGAELAEEYLPESISPAVSGYARNVAIGLKQTLGGQEPTPEETQKATEGFKQTFGEYADIPAGFLSGYSANYTPQIHAPEDASTGHKIASGAAHMFGMGLNIAQGGPLLGVTKAIPFAQGLAKAATKWAPSIVQRVATTAAPEAITFGLYEGISKPDEGVTRMDNALHGLGMGAAFGAGRGLMVGLGAKAFPTFASALAKTEPTPAMLGLANAIRSGEKLTAKGMEAAKGFKLTPGEKTAIGISDWATTISLGAAAGAAEPAKDWQDRLTNIGVGAGSFALAHAAHPKSFSFLRPRATEGMDKIWEAAEQETPFEEKVRTYTEAGMPEQEANFRAAKDAGLDNYFETTKADLNTVEGIHKAFENTGVPPDVISHYYDYTTAKTEADKMREAGQTEDEIKAQQGDRYIPPPPPPPKPEPLSDVRQGFVDQVKAGKITASDAANHAYWNQVRPGAEKGTEDEGLKTILGGILQNQELVNILKELPVIDREDIGGAAVYSPNHATHGKHIGLRTSDITNKTDLSAIIVEETIHALANRKLTTDATSLKTIRDLMDIAKGTLKDEHVATVDKLSELLTQPRPDMEAVGKLLEGFDDNRRQILYALSDPREFLAHAMSRKGFQDFISNIKYDKGVREAKEGTLWNRFVTWINDTLFPGKDYTTLLHKTLETGANILDMRAQEQAELERAFREEQTEFADKQQTGAAKGSGTILFEKDAGGRVILNNQYADKIGDILVRAQGQPWSLTAEDKAMLRDFQAKTADIQISTPVGATAERLQQIKNYADTLDYRAQAGNEESYSLKSEKTERIAQSL